MIHVCGTDVVHYFLLEQGGRVTLVDAGLRGYRSQLDGALAAIGRSIEDVDAVVLTHADPDHVGFAGLLQAEHGTPVYVHRLDADRTRTGKLKKTEGSMMAMLRGRRGRQVFVHMMRNGGMVPARVPEVQIFDDGDELDVPGRPLVRHTPGHSDGHCALHVSTEDAVFVGDAINNHSLVTGRDELRVPPPLANTSTAQAVDSLAVIEGIEASHIYFGHGDPSHLGTRAVVAEARRAQQ